MSADTPNTPTPNDPKKPSRKSSLQDSKQANEIAYADRMLGTIQTNAALKGALAILGYNDAELTIGANRQALASEKFDKRQAALAQAEQDPKS